MSSSIATVIHYKIFTSSSQSEIMSSSIVTVIHYKGKKTFKRKSHTIYSLSLSLSYDGNENPKDNL